jgi:DNA-directed RNA polymerase subunit K/omega
MIHRPRETNAFEFVRVATLRAAQLMRGCSPRVVPSHRSILTAQLEVVSGLVRADARPNRVPAANGHDRGGRVS